MKEEWKDIKGFENIYQVSNLGRVRSLDRVVVTKNGHGMKFKGKMLKFREDRYGYHYLSMYNKKTFTKKPHRLVAETFIPNPKNYKQVNHIDRVKTNNKIDNLEWCDASHNIQHSMEIGLRVYDKVGEDMYTSTYTEDQVREVINMLNQDKSHSEISQKVGMTKGNIYNIKKRKSWKHLSHLFKDNYVK